MQEDMTTVQSNLIMVNIIMTYDVRSVMLHMDYMYLLFIIAFSDYICHLDGIVHPENPKATVLQIDNRIYLLLIPTIFTFFSLFWEFSILF